MSAQSREQFLKSVTRFSDKNCGKNKNLEQFVRPSETKTARAYDCYKMPHIERGMKIGLYGGSFNPPHSGHKHLAETALLRFGLDQIWWMVAPANPLKDKTVLAPLEERIARSRALVHHPRIHITGFEAGLRTNCSADTVAFIRHHHRDKQFVWLMGADNLANFHLWQHWRKLANIITIGVIDRPDTTMAASSSLAAQALSRFRLCTTKAASLAFYSPPRWCFIHAPRFNISSSHLRLLST